MTDLEASVAGHYGRGGLYERILDGLRRAGVDLDAVVASDLKPVDEFHIGGLLATEAFLDPIAVGAGDQVIDIGSGLGGTARYIAARTGARVLGVDLTPEFVETARKLSELVGADGVSFTTGSALDLPAEDGVFDLATMLHVGMNISDKPALFAEAFRVLRPGGTFAVYDVMRLTDEALQHPLPWASESSQNFIGGPDDYREAAAAAGFGIVSETDRTDFADAFFARLKEQASADGPPPLSLAITMGDGAAERVESMIANLASRRIAPREMILEKPA